MPQSTIQDYFDRLSDSKVNYTAKEGLVRGLGEYFTSPNAKVTTIGVNNTPVADMTVKDFVETLRTTNQRYLFLSGNKDGDLYNTIKVRAN